MRIFRRAEPEPDQYDPRAHRAEIGEAVARAFQIAHPEIQVGRVAHGVTGPLGGESSKFFVVAVVDDLPRRFIVNVYAHGVFADGFEVARA